MVSAIETYLDTVRTLVGDESSKFGWPVYGLSVRDVLKIDPQKPFYGNPERIKNASSTSPQRPARAGQDLDQ